VPGYERLSPNLNPKLSMQEGALELGQVLVLLCENKTFIGLPATFAFHCLSSFTAKPAVLYYIIQGTADRLCQTYVTNS